jgi:hypothetical protein
MQYFAAYLVHMTVSRIVNDVDLGLFGGSRLPATGLARLVELGDSNDRALARDNTDRLTQHCFRDLTRKRRRQIECSAESEA